MDSQEYIRSCVSYFYFIFNDTIMPDMHDIPILSYKTSISLSSMRLAM